MGIMSVAIKIMPSSIETDLNIIKTKSKKIIENEGGKIRGYNEQPIAFGLKALIAVFEWSEDAPLEPLETKLQNIKDINSVQITDMRKIA